MPIDDLPYQQGPLLDNTYRPLKSSPNLGFHKYNTQQILRDYFKDRDTFNFKYGLELGLNSSMGGKSTDHATFNLDEDPTIFGFDLYILDKSPLFNDIDGFIDFGVDNGIVDIYERRSIYEDFVNQFSKFFNVDDRNKEQFKTNNNFNSFKTHYLNGVQGLDKLLHYTGVGYEGGNQMANFGTDKITIRMSEDIGINAGYLASVYRSLIYSKLNGRAVIPENLLRFDMAIVISEVRNMNRVSNALSKLLENSYEQVPILKDNISRYIFTLNECQINFNKYSFSDEINQGGIGGDMDSPSQGLEFDVYYKYVGMEMEKFDFRPDTLDEAKYINDSRLNPSTYQTNSDPFSDINKQTEAPLLDKHPNRPIDRKYQMNTKGNSELEDRSYEFDFPMMNSRYVKANQDARYRNREIQSEQSGLRRGLNNIIDNANEQLQTRVIQFRSQLLSGIVAKIRERTGIRNIAAPVNVYEGTNIGQFALNQLHNFVNLGVSEVLSNGFLNNLSQGVENSVFDRVNRGVNSLKGLEEIPNTTRDILSGNDIPNVYTGE